ncbi:MAG: hypothetical protein ACPG5P_06130, partial [Saprospiraceae bacterium]
MEIPNNYVVVEKFNEKYLEDSLKNIPYNYYLGNNIIIPENSERIFYHDTKLLCGTDWEVNHPPLPINFDRNPLFAFSSIGEFSTSVKAIKNLNGNGEMSSKQAKALLAATLARMVAYNQV